MRRFPGGACAALAMTLACSALPVSALASARSRSRADAPVAARAADVSFLATGGTAAGAAAGAVSASLAGGSEAGAAGAVALQPPIVSIVEAPGSVVAGKAPRVRLRVDSKRAGTVHVKVTLYQSSAREPIVVANMGWVHVGRTLTVRWPRGARLQQGSYHIAVGVHGHRSGPAHAFAHASRVIALTVLAPPQSTSGAGAALPAGVPTPAEAAALGAVFPVAGTHNFGGPENRFGASRAGHVHEGQDILTAEGTPIVAPLAGTIITTGYQASAAGYYAAEHTSAGLDFFFAHCREGSLLVKANEAVAVGAQLCAAGQTGDATTPHLHFEIWIGGWRAPGAYAIDPLPYLEAWERPGG